MKLFTNEMITSLRTNINKNSEITSLLIYYWVDDIQFFAEKQTQEEFFTFNALFNKSKQITYLTKAIDWKSCDIRMLSFKIFVSGLPVDTLPTKQELPFYRTAEAVELIFLQIP